MSDRKATIADLRKAHMAKLNEWLGAKTRLMWAEATFGPLFASEGMVVDQAFADDAWETLGVRVSWKLRPNPNYRPPSMDGCDERGWPIVKPE